MAAGSQILCGILACIRHRCRRRFVRRFHTIGLSSDGVSTLGEFVVRFFASMVIFKLIDKSRPRASNSLGRNCRIVGSYRRRESGEIIRSLPDTSRF